MEYWYAVITLPPVMLGARSTRVNPPTSGASVMIVGASGRVSAAAALKVRVDV